MIDPDALAQWESEYRCLEWFEDNESWHKYLTLLGPGFSATAAEWTPERADAYFEGVMIIMMFRIMEQRIEKQRLDLGCRKFDREKRKWSTVISGLEDAIAISTDPGIVRDLKKAKLRVEVLRHHRQQELGAHRPVPAYGKRGAPPKPEWVKVAISLTAACGYSKAEGTDLVRRLIQGARSAPLDAE